MKLCKDCEWFGVEQRKVQKTFYNALNKSVDTILKKEDVIVCNKNNPAIALMERVNGCEDFKMTDYIK